MKKCVQWLTIDFFDGTIDEVIDRLQRLQNKYKGQLTLYSDHPDCPRLEVLEEQK